MTDEPCAKCGHPRAEHSINGACYGLCGEFVAPHPAPDATDNRAVEEVWHENAVRQGPAMDAAEVVFIEQVRSAPDATDWKALCGAAVMERNAMRDKCMGCITPAEHADALTAAQAENEKLREALKPFADYADPSRRISPHLILTKGSALARRQLTMGDCYAALAALSPPPLSPEKP